MCQLWEKVVTLFLIQQLLTHCYYTLTIICHVNHHNNHKKYYKIYYDFIIIVETKALVETESGRSRILNLCLWALANLRSKKSEP